MPERAATPRYTAGAAPPSLWSAPDPALTAAGIEGETVVARVRVVAMTLLMIAPTWNVAHHPGEAMHVTGFIVTLLAAIIAVGIWAALRRGRWRPWIGFASSALDVTMISTALLSFYLVSSPLVALNSSVTFEMYFLAITATSLRYDARICIASGALAIAQYGGLWLVASFTTDLHDPAFVADAGPYLAVDLATRLVLMAIATLLAVTLVRRAQRLLYLAARDRLTGLYNRGHFDHAFDGAIAATRRSEQPLSVALIDIDHFKRINDERGHAAGDLAIRAIADRLAAAMRRTDLVARYGGEEFVVLLPGTPPAAALARIEALRVAIAATPLDLGVGGTLEVNFSAGIAGLPADAGGDDGRFPEESPADLLNVADERLLGAKRGGRGRCVGPAAP